MKFHFPLNLVPFNADANLDLIRATVFAQKALTAENKEEAKYNHTIAAFYWARAN